MALKAHIHAPVHVAVIATAALVAAVATGCGGGGGGGAAGAQQSAGDFIRQVTTQFSLGQNRTAVGHASPR